jgi:hypothetical protein
MGKDYPTIEKHLGQVTQTEFVAHAPQYHQTDDIRRIVQTVEERACPFIETASTAATAKPTITSRCDIGTFRGNRRAAMWTIHLPPPLTNHHQTLYLITKITNWRKT